MRMSGFFWAIFCAGFLLVAACGKTETGATSPIEPPGQPVPSPTPKPQPAPLPKDAEPNGYFKITPPPESEPPLEFELPADVIEVVSPKRCSRLLKTSLVNCREEVLATLAVAPGARLLQFETLLLGNCSTPYPIFVTLSFDGKAPTKYEILLNRKWLVQTKGTNLVISKVGLEGAYNSTCRVGVRMSVVE